MVEWIICHLLRVHGLFPSSIEGRIVGMPVPLSLTLCRFLKRFSSLRCSFTFRCGRAIFKDLSRITIFLFFLAISHMGDEWDKRPPRDEWFSVKIACFHHNCLSIRRCNFALPRFIWNIISIAHWRTLPLLARMRCISRRWGSRLTLFKPNELCG